MLIVGSLRERVTFFMNPINSSELTLFAQELQCFLSPRVLQETARQVDFVQRSSKYQANKLIALCVWLSQEVASTSLTQLSSRLEASTGLNRFSTAVKVIALSSTIHLSFTEQFVDYTEISR